jgi:hypothetical protein
MKHLADALLARMGLHSFVQSVSWLLLSSTLVNGIVNRSASPLKPGGWPLDLLSHRERTTIYMTFEAFTTA